MEMRRCRRSLPRQSGDRRVISVRLCVGGLLVVMAAGGPLHAQQPVVVDAGVSVAHFADDNATAVGPLVRLSIAGVRGHAFGSAEGGALGTVGAASGYASLAGGARTSNAPGWAGELFGVLAAVAGSNTAGGAGTALLGARGLWSSDAVGSWLRGTGHASSRTHGTLSGGGLDAGAWWAGARTRLTATMLQEWTRAELFTGRFRTGYAGTAAVRYTEGAVALHAEGDYAALDVSASSRRDADARALFEQGASVEVAYWPRSTVAFVLSAIHQLPDFVRGSDGVDAVSVGMRFGQAAPVIARTSRMLPVVRVLESNGARVLRVHAAGARTVDVMGDFTEWEPRMLVLSGGVFEGTMVMSSGTHRMLVRIDGGPWRPAANTPAVDDDLGGRVGLLVVP